MNIKRHKVGPRMAQANICNGIAFLSGQVPKNSLDQDITAQAREVLAAIDALLARAGSDKSRILMCQIFITDLADFAAMNEVWEAWLPAGHAPPRATVLARLAKPEWKLEMVVTAAVG